MESFKKLKENERLFLISIFGRRGRVALIIGEMKKAHPFKFNPFYIEPKNFTGKRLTSTILSSKLLQIKRRNLLK
jgi:hypothetical protein